MQAGRIAAGSSRGSRLDPFSLPVRFETADEAADEQRRVIDLHREHVVVHRSVRGMRMALNLPVTAFRGVAIRLNRSRSDMPTAIDVVLEHGDPALSLPLFSSSACDDIVAEWQSWGRVLGLPLLVAERDGSLREPFARIGAVASKRRPGGAGGAAPLRADVPKSCCGAGRASRFIATSSRGCIAASAKSVAQKLHPTPPSAGYDAGCKAARVEQQSGKQDQTGIAIGFEQREAQIGIGDIEADDLPGEVRGEGEQGQGRRPAPPPAQ